LLYGFKDVHCDKSKTKISHEEINKFKKIKAKRIKLTKRTTEACSGKNKPTINTNRNIIKILIK
jgi:hypothetical protein